MDKKLHFGLPIGSLNHPARWSTKAFLDDAGLYTKGYEPGSKSYFPSFYGEGTEYLEAVAVRPQRVPMELWAKARGSPSKGLDIAITGSDWADEGEAAGFPIKKLCSLGYGKVRLYAAVREECKAESVSELLEMEKGETILCHTEYIYRSAGMFLSDPVYKKMYGQSQPEIEVFGVIINKGKNVNKRVRIVYSAGTTELNIPSGFGTMIIENSQTGETMAKNKLKIIAKLGTSFARLYARPDIEEDKEKWDKVKYIKDLLQGTALAKKYMYSIFDFPVEKETEILEYMKSEGLYQIVPFVQKETGWCETKILVPKNKRFAVIEGLKRYGAKANVIFEIKSLINPITDRNGKTEEEVSEEIDKLLESNEGGD